MSERCRPPHNFDETQPADHQTGNFEPAIIPDHLWSPADPTWNPRTEADTKPVTPIINEPIPEPPVSDDDTTIFVPLSKHQLGVVEQLYWPEVAPESKNKTVDAESLFVFRFESVPVDDKQKSFIRFMYVGDEIDAEYEGTPVAEMRARFVSTVHEIELLAPELIGWQAEVLTLVTAGAQFCRIKYSQLLHSYLSGFGLTERQLYSQVEHVLALIFNARRLLIWLCENDQPVDDQIRFPIFASNPGEQD